MHRIRELVTVAAIVALSAVSLAATLEVARRPLPRGASVDFRDLDAWLATHDLAHEPPGTLFRIITQLERETRHARQWQEQLETFSPAELEQYSRNFALLTETWFFHQVDEFFRCQEDRREAFIDRKLTTILNWSSLGRPAGSSEQGKRRRMPLLGELGARMTDFAVNGDPVRQAQAAAFLEAVKAGFIRRTLERLQPSD